MGSLTILLRDLTGLAGIGLITYGSWLIFHPAGFIVGGVLALGISILTARGE